MDVLIGDMTLNIVTLDRLAQLVAALDDFVGGQYFLRIEAVTNKDGLTVLKISKEPVD